MKPMGSSIDEIVNQKVALGMKMILKKITVLVEDQVRIQLEKYIQERFEGGRLPIKAPRAAAKESK